MKIIKNTLYYVVISLILHFLFVLFRIYVLEDINIFGEMKLASLIWFSGATVTYLILEWLTHGIKSLWIRHSIFFGFLCALLMLGMSIPYFSHIDGIAGGLIIFLNIYWISSIVLYKICILSVIYLKRKGNKANVLS